VSEKAAPAHGLNAIVGLLIALTGAVLAYLSFRLPQGPDPSAPGPGIVPGALGVFLLVAGLATGGRSALSLRSSTGEAHGLFGRKPVIAMALLAASAGLLEPFGFMLSTFAFLTAGFRWLGDAPFSRALPAAAVCAVLMWLFFTKLLGVGLPYGRLVEILFT
jgi:putative tricarboxylic transport membrane protein